MDGDGGSDSVDLDQIRKPVFGQKLVSPEEGWMKRRLLGNESSGRTLWPRRIGETGKTGAMGVVEGRGGVKDFMK